MGRTSLNWSETRPNGYRSTVEQPRGVVVNDYGVSSSYATTESRIRETVNTVDFRRKKRSVERHQLPINPFYYRESFSGPATGFTLTNPDGTDLWHRRVGSPEPTFDSDTMGLDASIRSQIGEAALVGILKKLQDGATNLGNVFAERKQTSEMILGSAKRLAGAYRKLKSGDANGAFRELGYARSGIRDLHNLKVGGTKKNIKQASDDFLMWRYGAVPLAEDVYSAAEGLAKYKEGGLNFSVTCTRTHSWVKNSPMSVTQWNYVPVLSQDKGKFAVKYVINFTYSLEHVHALAQWGLTNPAEWLWEATPWSFVFDWWLKIGEWIDLWDATAGLQFVSGSHTTFESWTIRQRALGSVHADGALHITELSGLSRRLVECRRTPLASFPALVLPRTGTGLNLARGENAVALLLQRMFRKH